MNEEIKQKADDILTKHYREIFSIRVALKHAILSTKNTIEVLEQVERERFTVTISKAILKQTEILKELESRI